MGRFKAPFFVALGYTQEQWQRLESDFRAQHLAQEAQPAATSPYGQKYEIRAMLTAAGGRSAEVVSVWIILAGEDAPRFVTAYLRRCSVKFRRLDVVVLERDLPAHGLKRGDLGAVVELYEPDGLEVEFVTASGRTEALVTLIALDVRPVVENDLVAVRPYLRSA